MTSVGSFQYASVLAKYAMLRQSGKHTFSDQNRSKAVPCIAHIREALPLPLGLLVCG